MIAESTPVVKGLPLGGPVPRLSWTTFPALRGDQTAGSWGGVHNRGTLGDLADWIAHEHAGPAYPKGRGPTFHFGQLDAGHRANHEVRQLSGIVLDCDGGGDWPTLLGALDAMGGAYVAYRSSGDGPAKRKWRIILPFAQVLRVADSAAAMTLAPLWHAVYAHAVAVIGQLGGGIKFDPSTKDIARLFFLGHLRPEMAGQAPREVIYRDGRGIDGQALFAAAQATAKAQATQWSPTAGTGGTGRTQYLPGDTLIAMTRGRNRDVGTVRLDAVQGHSHCRCPQHGGSGSGTAWVGLTPWGDPFAHCAKCALTWMVDRGQRGSPMAQQLAGQGKYADQRSRGSLEDAVDKAEALAWEAEQRVAEYTADPYFAKAMKVGEQRFVDPARYVDPRVADAAVDVLKHANDLMRDYWRGVYKGFSLERKGCGVGVAGVYAAAAQTGGLRMACRSRGCAVCGPRVCAEAEAAIWGLPLVHRSGKGGTSMIGTSLASRDRLGVITTDQDGVARYAAWWRQRQRRHANMAQDAWFAVPQGDTAYLIVTTVTSSSTTKDAVEENVTAQVIDQVTPHLRAALTPQDAGIPGATVLTHQRLHHSRGICTNPAEIRRMAVAGDFVAMGKLHNFAYLRDAYAAKDVKLAVNIEDTDGDKPILDLVRADAIPATTAQAVFRAAGLQVYPHFRSGPSVEELAESVDEHLAAILDEQEVAMPTEAPSNPVDARIEVQGPTTPPAANDDADAHLIAAVNAQLAADRLTAAAKEAAIAREVMEITDKCGTQCEKDWAAESWATAERDYLRQFEAALAAV